MNNEQQPRMVPVGIGKQLFPYKLRSRLLLRRFSLAIEKLKRVLTIELQESVEK